MGPIEIKEFEQDQYDPQWLFPLKVKQILSLYFRSQSEIFLTNRHKSDLANRVFSEILPAEQDKVDDNAQVNLGRSQSILVEAPELP